MNNNCVVVVVVVAGWGWNFGSKMRISKSKTSFVPRHNFPHLSIILIDRDPDLGTPSLSIIIPSIAAAALLLLWIVVVIEMKLITNKLIYYDIKCD